MLLCQDYSNRVPVLLAQMVAIRFPSASKIWTVPVPVKLSTVVSCIASVASALKVKIAFRGIAVTHSSIRVIMIAWLALPNTVFGSLTGIATRWDPIAGVSAALIVGHDSRK